MDIKTKNELKKLCLELSNFILEENYEIEPYKEKKIYGASCLYRFIENNDIECYREFLMIYKEFDLKDINKMFECFMLLNKLKQDNLDLPKRKKIKKLKERK